MGRARFLLLSCDKCEKMKLFAKFKSFYRGRMVCDEFRPNGFLVSPYLCLNFKISLFALPNLGLPAATC